MLIRYSTFRHAKPATALAVLLPATYGARMFTAIALDVVVCCVSLCATVMSERYTLRATLCMQADPAVNPLLLVLAHRRRRSHPPTSGLEVRP